MLVPTRRSFFAINVTPGRIRDGGFTRLMSTAPSTMAISSGLTVGGILFTPIAAAVPTMHKASPGAIETPVAVNRERIDGATVSVPAV